jgi:hypothetical protein
MSSTITTLAPGGHKGQGYRNQAREISQVPLFHHVICGISIMRDQLLGAL